MSATSPGPWVWLEADEPDALTPFTIGDADSNDLAEVFSSECSTVPTTREQGRANARLMAAAPTLLSALIECAALVAAWDHHQPDADSFPQLGMARAAIAAATGEPA